MDVDGDIWQTWAIWKPHLEPFYTPEAIPVHPIVRLTQYCGVMGFDLKFSSVDGHMATQNSDLSDTSSDSEEEMGNERLCGKEGLRQLEPSKVDLRIFVKALVNGKVVGEGYGTHTKGAKKAAALAAIKKIPWDLK